MLLVICLCTWINKVSFFRASPKRVWLMLIAVASKSDACGWGWWIGCNGNGDASVMMNASEAWLSTANYWGHRKVLALKTNPGKSWNAFPATFHRLHKSNYAAPSRDMHLSINEFSRERAGKSIFSLVETNLIICRWACRSHYGAFGISALPLRG